MILGLFNRKCEIRILGIPSPNYLGVLLSIYYKTKLAHTHPVVWEIMTLT
jgi:hypothetical protein